MIILKNCTYQIYDITIVWFDQLGISNTNLDMAIEESNIILNELLPERILKDYKYWRNRYSPILELIPYFNKTRGLHKLICCLAALLVRVYSTFIKKNNHSTFK